MQDSKEEGKDEAKDEAKQEEKADKDAKEKGKEEAAKEDEARGLSPPRVEHVFVGPSSGCEPKSCSM